jgi:hypothetical protein
MLVGAKFVALMVTPGHHTEWGRRFDSVVKHLMGGDLPPRLEGMAERYILNLNPRNPGPGRATELWRHAVTRHIHYDTDPGLGADAATLNREIPRVAPEPGARSREVNPVFAELTGKIRVPLVAIHETADFPVPFRLQQEYRRRAERAGTSHLLVQRAVRATGHCGFDNAESVPAFDDLVKWIENGSVPAGDNVLGDVTKLGLCWTHVRDPRDPDGCTATLTIMRSASTDLPVVSPADGRNRRVPLIPLCLCKGLAQGERSVSPAAWPSAHPLNRHCRRPGNGNLGQLCT